MVKIRLSENIGTLQERNTKHAVRSTFFNAVRRTLYAVRCTLYVFLFLFLFPLYCQAGPVNIPGFYGSVIKAPAAQSPVLQPSVPINIPGFYGPTVTPPPTSAVPRLLPSGIQQGATVVYPSSNQCTINQNQQYSIIDWASFNIGANASTVFDQQGNANWVVLNRIWDINPSLIFGKLAADGKVYLINQNGILFGPGSQVNVNSLVASALNIKNTDFLKGVINFYQENGSTTGDVDTSGNPYSYDGLTFNPSAAVSNYGEINAAMGGSVFLIGPRVENGGLITAPLGQIGLAAGLQVALAADPGGARTALVVEVPDAGSDKVGDGQAWNRDGGQLIADEGLVGMYGRIVNQDGLIRSVTAVTLNGKIELRATEEISTGSNSITESPISDSSDTADNSFPFSGGQIVMDGLQTINGQNIVTSAPPALIDHGGTVYAPSGQVTMNAGTRVFLDTGSSINVGGAWSNEAVTANILQAQLNSVELADAYLQKGGLLQGQTITVNMLTGSSIGNISGEITTRELTALEKSIAGGTINVNVSSGDIIIKQGAVLNFSGGGIQYSGGDVDTTELVSGTNIYDISSAPATVQYNSILGQYTKTYDGFGITQSYSGIYYGGATPLNTYIAGYTKGGDAGSLTLAAGTVVLDGQLSGSMTQGLYQTNKTLQGSASLTDYQTTLQLSKDQGLEIPSAGQLTINTTSTNNAQAGITVSRNVAPLPANFGPDPGTNTLTNPQTVVSSKSLNAAGLGSLTLSANTNVTINSDASIVLSPGGFFSATAGRIEHYGEITVPSGTITLQALGNNNAAESAGSEIEDVFLSPGSILDVSGQKVDNSLAGKSAGTSVVSGLIQGGYISIEDKANTLNVNGGGNVLIQEGAILDVSGGYLINTNGKISGGNAGTLDIGGSTLMLNGDIRGYALADSNGGLREGRSSFVLMKSM